MKMYICKQPFIIDGVETIEFCTHPDCETNVSYQFQEGSNEKIEDFGFMVREAKEAVEKRNYDPVMIGNRTVSDTEVVIKLATMPDWELERHIRSGRIALINELFGFKPGHLTKRIRAFRKLEEENL